MTTAIVLKKATKPSLIIGGMLLTVLGLTIMTASEMTFGKEEDGTSKSVNKYARVGIGAVLFFIGLVIGYKGIFDSESAA